MRSLEETETWLSKVSVFSTSCINGVLFFVLHFFLLHFALECNFNTTLLLLPYA